MPHSRSTLRRGVRAGACGILVLAGTPLSAQEGCPTRADSLVTSGWESYRGAAVASAELAFRRAREGCPGHLGALTGLGYVSLRRGEDSIAAELFARVIRADSTAVDALVGRGILHWRAGDLAEVDSVFRRVRDLDPTNETAAAYLAWLPEAPGVPPDRPPLVLPDSLEYPARVNGDRFEVRTADGWRPFYIKGVNLGAALPGKHPSEFPDSASYASWLADMAAMGANAVRVYTIHPPWFYQVLKEHNRAHPGSPLWLIHGVWTELPPDHDYDDPAWSTEFFNEMRRVVDLLHGRADIPPRPGHALGSYTADVSSWTLAYIIGREWEPFSIVEYNARRPDRAGFRGRYLTLSDGTPADAWMARACEEIIAYEVDTYRAQRPTAYTNWPTLDPLHHHTETTVAEEVALREGMGESVDRVPLEYDNDSVGLDASLVTATDSFPAGYFASYHAYPYYPDFLVLDSAYNVASSSEGRSNYFGYLTELKAHHSGMAVVISEYGVPASLGIAHFQPQGWHHGGHNEEDMAAINGRLTREIAEAGMAGGALFAWIDEWFKKNWIVIDFEIPLERNRLWLNRLDAEQHYGVIAMEPVPPIRGRSLSERAATWRAVPALYRSPAGRSLRAAADEAYLWLSYRQPPGALPDRLVVGFDLVDPDAGETRWPERIGPPLPVGVEIALAIDSSGARILADGPANLTRVVPVRRGESTTPTATDSLFDGPLPPGTFAGRFEQRFNRPYRTLPSDAGTFEPLLVITNRPRFSRDGREYAGMGYDRGRLPSGPPPDGLWEADSSLGLIEARVPWTLLGVTDPSSRRIVYDSTTADMPRDIGTALVPGIRIVAASLSGDTWTSWPASGRRGDVALFSWPTWEEPRWRARRRPLFQEMRETFDSIRPAVLAGGER